LWIANPEQRTSARRFQNHLIGPPSHIGKSRKDEIILIAELQEVRPIIGHLRLDDHLIFAALRPLEAIFQKTVLCQAPDQSINLFVDSPATRRKRA
jgi:hypothetical protein